MEINSRIHRYAPRSQSLGEYPYLWLGLWSLGGEGFGFQDMSVSKAVVSKALERGVYYFDTAHFYSHGKSDRLLAPFLKNNRKDIFISSKAGLRFDGKTVVYDGSEQHIRETLYKSLESLKTDYIDLFSLHWPDPKISVRDSINTLKLLQKEGLIRFWGVSNFSSTDILIYLEKGALTPHQIHHNPISDNTPILNTGYAHDKCINCIYSPFEQGLLSSSSSSKGLAFLGKKDCRRRNKYFKDPLLKEWLNMWRKLYTSFLLNPQQIILLWLLLNDQIDVVIFGSRTTTQLNEVLDFKYLKKTLTTTQLLRFLDEAIEK